MKLKLKLEFLDCAILNPLTNQIVSCRFIPSEEYIILYNLGLTSLFDVEEEVIIKEEIKTKNDLPNTEPK